VRLRGSVWIGLLLIVVGALLVLRNSDVIGEDIALWPIVLLTVGILLALGNRRPSPGSWIAPLVLITIGGVFLLRDLEVIGEDVPLGAIVLIAVGAALVLGSLGGSTAGPSRSLDVAAPGATSGRVSIDYGAGRLRIGALPSGSGALCRGRVSGDATDRLDLRGDRADLRIRHRPGVWVPFAAPGRRDWTLDLDPALPLDLSIRTGASKCDVDLRELRVVDLNLETGASDVHVALPREGRVKVRVQAGAAAVRLDVPAGVAARIRSDSGLASFDVDEGRFPRRGDEFESEGYSTAEHRADIVIKGGVGSFRVA
jgi:hypothetical protein